MGSDMNPASDPCYDDAPRALIVADPDKATLAEAMLDDSGFRPGGHASPAELSGSSWPSGSRELLFFYGPGMGDSAFASTARRLMELAVHGGAAVVAEVTPDQLDLCTPLIGERSQILCEPSLGERLAAFAIAARLVAAPEAVLHDVAREGEPARLKRLNEEIARIADTLARLSRGDEAKADGNGSVRDAATGFRPRMDGSNDTSPGAIRAAIRARRLREQIFGDGLFADPAWDMILDLYASHLEHRRVSVSSLCIAAAVPPTTALRWIATLVEAELFERQADPHDRRRAYIGLTDKGHQAMQRYLETTRQSGMPIA